MTLFFVLLSEFQITFVLAKKETQSKLMVKYTLKVLESM